MGAAELAIVRSPAEEAIVTRYPAFKSGQAHWAAPAVARVREEGFATLKRDGLPNRRVEEWKYTDLRGLLRDLPEPSEGPSPGLIARAEAMHSALAVEEATRLLFVNGRLMPPPQADGFSCAALAGGEALASGAAEAMARPRAYADNVAVALNSAFMSDWIVLRVPAGTTLARPLHLAFRDIGAAPFASYPRIFVMLEAGATATVVETHDGPDAIPYLTNLVVEFDVANGAHLEHVRVNASGKDAIALATAGVRLGRGATFASTIMSTGAAASRQQVFVTFAGEGSRADIRGATLLRGTQHCDSTLVIDHAKAGCVSRETFKTVLDGDSRGVFQGKTIVRPHAQKTDGKMASHAILLSDGSEMDNKPELEIFADDVVCGHGATSGRLDEELLFYLRARGLPSKEAEALLIQSFVGEAIEGVTNDGLRETMVEAVARWLDTRA